MNSKKRLKEERQKLNKSNNNRYKSRGLPPPTIKHGEEDKPREKTVEVVETKKGKVDIDAYTESSD